MAATIEELAKKLGATINQQHGVTILVGSRKSSAGVMDKPNGSRHTKPPEKDHGGPPAEK